MLPPLLVLALSLALGACSGTDSPLAPSGTDEAPAPASESAAPDFIVTGGTQRIAFNSARNGGYEIFKMDPLGGNVVQLTKSAFAGEPAWSHGNTRIAMVRERLDANKVSHTDIYVINADGTGGHWARSTPFTYNLRYPSWSPDGSRILMTILQVGKPYLATLNLATGQVKFVTSGGIGVQGNYPSYDPTGHRPIDLGTSTNGGETMKTATTLALSSLIVLALAAFTAKERPATGHPLTEASGFLASDPEDEGRPMQATGMFTATRQ